MNEPIEIDRRKALKALGAGIVGATATTGTVTAHDPDNRRHDSFTWARGSIWEMLDTEPPGVRDLDPGLVDDEGAHESHRPIWIIASMAGTGVDGSEHSPHPNPEDLFIDHVVPLEDFSAQWHITTVSSSPTNPFALTNVDSDGNHLISADAIETAEENGDIHTHPLFHPGTGEPAVFTCPVRPHHD